MNKQSFSFLKFFLILCVGCLVSVIVTLNFAQKVSAKESSFVDKYKYLKTFTEVLSLVERNYVEPVNIEELTDGAIKGMLLTLDPHSSYLSKDVYNELQVETEGQFGGLGIEITIKDGLLTVVSPIEDSPAARAGVMPGDQIIKIGEEFSKDLSLIDAVKKMRGPKGSPITISVHRNGSRELIPITIVRDVIKVKSVRYRMLENGYGYVRLAQFQEGGASEFSKALEALQSKERDKKLKGLVIDLRNDPGGLLTQAIRVSDLFLKEGIIVYTEGRLESQKQKYYAHDDGTEPEYPITVLINKGSASASEIVAGALQDHKRAVIIGQQSFGKGSVQTILPMEHGDALRLTTALYYTKSGRSIQSQGVTPDVVVADKRFPSEADELLEEGENEAPTGKTETGKTPGQKGAEQGVKEKNEHLPIGSREAMQAEVAKLLTDDPQLAEALLVLKNGGVVPPKTETAAPEAKK
jgi:carboxyl-terminal processing protease